MPSGPAAAFDVCNPDFNIRLLRGTAVNRDKSALFRDRPVNVFQIKASYWLGM